MPGRATRIASAATMAGAVATLAGACNGNGAQQSALEACPALRPEANALDASYDSDERVNGKLRAYLQAAKDVDWAATQVEHLAAGACRRIGHDLGMDDAALQPLQGPGGVAAGACEPVAQRVEAVLREGVRPWVTVVPAQCQPNAEAWQRCGGRCDVNGDPECRASCQTHANVHAACHGAQVSVRASRGGEGAAPLVSTLEANLPALLEAEQTLGRRLIGEAGAMVQVGSGLAKQLAGASSDARACAGAGRDLSSEAVLRMRVSLSASATVTARLLGR